MSKEHAYAYEAGYRDGSIHYKLEHCPACKNVADLQEALTENTKLHKENDTLCRRIDELCMEVEKLQWLVSDMRACFRIGAERNGVSKQWCYELFDNYTNKLRELGIDTDV